MLHHGSKDRTFKGHTGLNATNPVFNSTVGPLTLNTVQPVHLSIRTGSVKLAQHSWIGQVNACIGVKATNRTESNALTVTVCFLIRRMHLLNAPNITLCNIASRRMTCIALPAIIS